MTKEEETEIKKLKEKLKHYEESPAAAFYTALVEGVKYITDEVKNKTLNLSDDTFADSILKLAEKSDKIFSGLEKGMSNLNMGEKEDTLKAKQLSKANSATIL